MEVPPGVFSDRVERKPLVLPKWFRTVSRPGLVLLCGLNHELRDLIVNTTIT